MMKRSKKKNKIDWDSIRRDWKKQAFLVMLIIFLPLSLYLLLIGKHLYFFFVAAVFYGLIQFIKRK